MGTKQPFDQVVSCHGTMVLRVCRAVLNAVDADDAWSDTFISALKAYPDLPEGANIEAWLVTIAYHKSIDILRRAGRQATPVSDFPNQLSDDQANRRDLDLVHSLASLPRKQRFAIAYHYLAGFSYEDVAAIIGGNAQAARRAAADGIANLRKIEGLIL